MNPLKNPWYSALAGLILALVLAFAIKGDYSANPIEWTIWFHVVVGIMWVGLLYYFNFVQVPAVNAAVADGDPGPAAINKYVAPKALWFFRWAALLTWLSGAAALWKMGILHQAFTLAEGTQAIGIGAWLGTIMLFNVWGLIWPNQKKLLGIKPASDAEKAKAKVVALYASRVNTILSIPMLMGMTASHYHNGGLPF
jgi:uncharacterized membrane protein